MDAHHTGRVRLTRAGAVPAPAENEETPTLPVAPPEEAPTTTDGALTDEEVRRQWEERNSEAARTRGTTAIKNPQEARKRLMRDLRSLQSTLATPAGEEMGIVVRLVNDNLFCWHAVIAGPAHTPWEGGLFRLELTFTAEYPMTPPHVRFLTKGVFHPNVYTDGNICLNTLKTNWTPTLDVEALLISIMSLLSDPNPHSAANGEAARLLVENQEQYNERIRRLVEESLEQSFTDEDEDVAEDV